MGNLTSCKIRIESILDSLSLKEVKMKVEQLQEQNEIYGKIFILNTKDRKDVEIWFSSKWYPSELIEEIFESDKYDIWVIRSDEGGQSDFLNHYPKSKKIIQPNTIKAIYSFDKIRLFGDIDDINKNLEQILGWGIKYYRKRIKKSFGIELDLGGIFKANNFFYTEYSRNIQHQELSNFETFSIPEKECEITKIIWNNDGIQFIDLFYKNIGNLLKQENKFPFLSKIEFISDNIITNSFRWEENVEFGEWKHYANNSFNNLYNYQYKIYKKLKAIR